MQEIEVLESIYPDELTQVSTQYPGVRFEVRLKLDLVPHDDSSFTADSLSVDHYLVVKVHLPETYPEVVPEVEIECEEEPKGGAYDDEDEDDNDEPEEIEYDEHGNPIEAKLTNLPDQIHFEEYADTLVSQLEQQADEDMLIGMQMCFALVSWIKESAERWFQESLSKLEREHERKLLEREKEEQKKFQGTKVTRESYLRWREQFRKEMGLDERDSARRLAAHNGKLSGRQIFEQGLDGSEDVDEDPNV